MLGALAPGEYVLNLSCNSYTAGPSYMPGGLYFSWPFVVPESGPGLSASLDQDQVRLSIEGVVHARYTIETSTNRLTWERVTTRTNAPFQWTAPLDLASPERYYRLRIEGSGSSSHSTDDPEA